MLRNRFIVGALACASLAGAGFAGAYTAGGEIPDAVRSAVEKYFGAGGGFEEPMMRTFDGAECFVVNGSRNGRPVMLALSKSGELQQAATTIAFDDLPREVRRKLRATYRNAEFAAVKSMELNLFEVAAINEETGNRQIVHIFAAGNRWPEATADTAWDLKSED